MAFDAWKYLTFFGVQDIKQARKGNLLARCPDFDGNHPRGDQRRSFGILERPAWRNGQWVPAGTSNCFVCGGMTLEQLTAKFLTRNLGRPVNELEAYLWLEQKGWLPEDNLDDIPFDNLLVSLKGLAEDAEDLDTYDPSVIDEYLKALHPSALQRGNTKNAIDLTIAREVFKLGYCERSKRTVIPVFKNTGRLYGVVSRATRPDDFIRYGVGVPDENYPNPGWKMKLDFLKSQVVFNEDKWNIFEKDTILVIESPLDVPYLYTYNIQEKIDIGAIFGAKPSQEQLDKICQYENVIMGLDNDEAGRNGTAFLYEELKRRKRNIYSFDHFGNKDTGDCTPDQIDKLFERVRKVTII